MNKLFESFAKSEKDGIIKLYSQALAEYFHQYEQHKVNYHSFTGFLKFEL